MVLNLIELQNINNIKKNCENKFNLQFDVSLIHIHFIIKSILWMVYINAKTCNFFINQKNK